MTMSGGPLCSNCRQSIRWEARLRISIKNFSMPKQKFHNSPPSRNSGLLRKLIHTSYDLTVKDTHTKKIPKKRIEFVPEETANSKAVG